MRARGIERASACLERAQIGDGDRQHVGEFLRLRAAGIVDHAAVGAGKGPAKACCRPDRKWRLEASARARSRAAGCRPPLQRRRSGRSRSGWRWRRAQCRGVHQCGEPGRGIVGCPDRDRGRARCRHRGARRRARARPPSSVGGETVAIGADRAGEDEREPGRAVFEIVQRLGIGRRRIGMVDALDDRPRRAGCAPRHRLRVRLAVVERLDGEPVIGPGDEPLVERRALEHAFDQLAPLLAGGRGKFGRQAVARRARRSSITNCHGANDGPTAIRRGG